MKANSDKSHLIMSCNEPSTLVIDGSSIETNTKGVFLGITIDKDLKFDDHINSLCKKACQKLNALARLAPYMKVEKKRTITMKAFTDLDTVLYSGCPIVGALITK